MHFANLGATSERGEATDPPPPTQDAEPRPQGRGARLFLSPVQGSRTLTRRACGGGAGEGEGVAEHPNGRLRVRRGGEKLGAHAVPLTCLGNTASKSKVTRIIKLHQVKSSSFTFPALAPLLPGFPPPPRPFPTASPCPSFLSLPSTTLFLPKDDTEKN